MTINGLPEAGPRVRASSWMLMTEEVFGRPLMELLHAFPDGLLHILPCFPLCTRNILLLDRWLSTPDNEKEYAIEGPKSLFLERMS
jgi:hypothetical protein